MVKKHKKTGTVYKVPEMRKKLSEQGESKGTAVAVPDLFYSVIATV